MTSMIGVGIASTVLPFGAAAVAAGTIATVLLLATAAVLIVADVRCAS